MEFYHSHCPDCGAKYQWAGFKTGVGKTEAQLEKMRENKTVCRECGSSGLKTGLGSYPVMEAIVKPIIEAIVETPVIDMVETKEILPGLDWIQTFMGLKFSFIDPKPEQISIIDIAHALSNTCRYAGHSNQFYSVAQHSVLVSQMVPQKFALQGLLHDAAEAYINDIPSPAKALPELVGFNSLEDRILKVIFEKYGLPEGITMDVKYADARMLLTEKKILFNTYYKWDIENHFEPYPIEIQPSSSLEAFKVFMCRFAELGGMQ